MTSDMLVLPRAVARPLRRNSVQFPEGDKGGKDVTWWGKNPEGEKNPHYLSKPPSQEGVACRIVPEGWMRFLKREEGSPQG